MASTGCYLARVSLPFRLVCASVLCLGRVLNVLPELVVFPACISSREHNSWSIRAILVFN